jgi:hypothetical protein
VCVCVCVCVWPLPHTGPGCPSVLEAFFVSMLGGMQSLASINLSGCSQIRDGSMSQFLLTGGPKPDSSKVCLPHLPFHILLHSNQPCFHSTTSADAYFRFYPLSSFGLPMSARCVD